MKPKAPRWLTEAFRDGVDEREAVIAWDEPQSACWLAQFDPTEKPCEGRFERFHFVGRQRVEHALGALLPITWEEVNPVGVASVEALINVATGEIEEYDPALWAPDLILLAAWDARNGGIACEAHHRRYDSHLAPVPSEQLAIPYEALPEHVLEFAETWGLEHELESAFIPQGSRS